MSDRVKANLLKYGISSGFAGLLVYIYCSSRNVFLEPVMERWRILCDAFTIPGLTLIMAGLLVVVANEGFFDMFSYAASKAAGMLLPGRGFSEKDEKYYDYLQRKRENRVHGFGFLFVVGGVCMVLALVFMMLFYRMYNA